MSLETQMEGGFYLWLYQGAFKFNYDLKLCSLMLLGEYLKLCIINVVKDVFATLWNFAAFVYVPYMFYMIACGGSLLWLWDYIG